MKNIYLALNQQVGLAIQPVLSSSKYFVNSALVGRPTLDPAMVERWWRDYRGCNWCTCTGASGRLLIVELEGDHGWNTARRISRGSKRWLDTTQYRAGKLVFFAYRYWGQQLHRMTRDLPGIRLHAGDPVLVPPSTLAGMEFEFVRIARHLQDTPSWLISDGNLLAA
jgi:hypothetical protein